MKKNWSFLIGWGKGILLRRLVGSLVGNRCPMGRRGNFFLCHNYDTVKTERVVCIVTLLFSLPLSEKGVNFSSSSGQDNYLLLLLLLL